jgi:hypothetical protein
VDIIKEYKQKKKQTIKYLFSCYHVREEATDEDDPHNIKITEIEG